MPLIITNDSSFPATNIGSHYLAITGAGLTGVCLAENLTITLPTTKIDLRNNINAPAGRITVDDFEAGTATLQVSGAFPGLGAQFGFGSVYYLDEVGKQYAQGDVYKAQVSFTKKYN